MLKETKHRLRYAINLFKVEKSEKTSLDRLEDLKDGRRMKNSRKGNCMCKGGKELGKSEKLKDQCSWMEHSEQSYRGSRGEITLAVVRSLNFILRIMWSHSRTLKVSIYIIRRVILWLWSETRIEEGNSFKMILWWSRR